MKISKQRCFWLASGNQDRANWIRGHLNSLPKDYHLLMADTVQMASYGIGLLQAISDKTNETPYSIKNRIESGLISKKEYLQTIIDLTNPGGRFYMKGLI